MRFCPHCQQMMPSERREWLRTGEVLALTGWSRFMLDKFTAGGAIQVRTEDRLGSRRGRCWTWRYYRREDVERMM